MISAIFNQSYYLYDIKIILEKITDRSSERFGILQSWHGMYRH